MNRMFTKLRIIIATGVLTSTTVMSQTVPNGGFETWVNKNYIYDPSISYEDLDSWATMNYTVNQASNTVKSAESNSGSFSALLTPSVINNTAYDNIIKQTFAISTKPQYINGYYKTAVLGNDYGQIALTIKDGANKFLATTGGNFKTNVLTFTPFSIKISNFYTAVPATAQIVINLISKDAGSKFWIDDITLSDKPLVTALDQDAAAKDLPLFYPNPVKDKLFIQNIPSSVTSFRLLNIHGKEVLKGNLTQNGVIDLSGQTTGVYFSELLNEAQNVILKSKIIINN